MQELQRKYFYTLTANIIRPHGGSYYHAYTMSADVSTARGPQLTEDDEKAFVELMRDLANWFYRTLEAEWEYQHADEQVDESIRANEYDFTEDGKRCVCL